MSTESPRLSNSVLSTRYSALSSYDLIRLHQRPLWDRETDLIRCLQVDHKLKLHRLLDGQVLRLGPFQNLIHVDSGAAEHVSIIRSIEAKTAGLHELNCLVH